MRLDYNYQMLEERVAALLSRDLLKQYGVEVDFIWILESSSRVVVLPYPEYVALMLMALWWRTDFCKSAGIPILISKL